MGTQASGPRQPAGEAALVPEGHAPRHPLLPLVLRNWISLLALLALVTIAALALLAPWISPYDPLAIDPLNSVAAPSSAHLLGTDELGRDLLSRIIAGGRASLGTAAGVAVASALLGVPLGLLMGYAAGLLDLLMSRLLDVLLAFPAILLAMGLIAVLGVGTLNAGVAVTIVSIPAFARLARASAMVEKRREYVEAARALGASHARILFRAILPNSGGPLLVQLGLTATNAILLEAALSFLGLGTKPPTPSWGAMLSTSRGYLYQGWWYGLFPGVMLTITVLALNGLTDGAQRITRDGWRRL